MFVFFIPFNFSLSRYGNDACINASCMTTYHFHYAKVHIFFHIQNISVYFFSTELLNATFIICLILAISVLVSMSKQVHLEAKTHIGIFKILQAGLNK